MTSTDDRLEENLMRCPFCPPALNAAHVVLENTHCLFLQQTEPVLTGSGIIIPKQHRETVFDLTLEEWQATSDLLQQAKERIDERLSEICTIILDLSEVLIAGLLGIEVPLAKLLRVPAGMIPPAFGDDLLEELCCARLTEDAYLECVIDRQGWRVSPEQLKPIIRRNFHRKVPGMQRVLNRLRPRYQLVLLSDHAFEWVAYIRKVHSFFDKFGALFFSYELGQTKRAPSTFTWVLDELGRKAQQCLFVDDSERNVAVARSAGLPSIRFAGAEQLTCSLRQMGLER